MGAGLAAQCSLAALISFTAMAQPKVSHLPDLSKPYWLNFSVSLREGCLTKVFPRNIVFPGEDCTARTAKTLTRGAKVKIGSISYENGLAKLTLRYWPEFFESGSDYSIFLDNSSQSRFLTAFNLLFSERVVEGFKGECSLGLQTKDDVIRCFGFPMYIEKRANVFSYKYNSDFVGYPFGSARAWTVKIKNNRVVGMSEMF